MKKSTAKHKILTREIESAAIMKNPTNLHEWFITLYSPSGMPHMLVDEKELAITDPDIQILLDHLKDIGLRCTKINF